MYIQFLVNGLYVGGTVFTRTIVNNGNNLYISLGWTDTSGATKITETMECYTLSRLQP
jgi:hypothetical protein